MTKLYDYDFPVTTRAHASSYIRYPNSEQCQRSMPTNRPFDSTFVSFLAIPSILFLVHDYLGYDETTE